MVLYRHMGQHSIVIVELYAYMNQHLFLLVFHLQKNELQSLMFRYLYQLMCLNRLVQNKFHHGHQSNQFFLLHSVVRIQNKQMKE